MRKIILSLLLISINACTSTKPEFVYEGEGALIPCTDKNYKNKMCEKDGNNLARGSWTKKISKEETINLFYAEGDYIGSETYIAKGDITHIVEDGKTFSRYLYCRKNNKLCSITCKNPNKNQKDITISDEELNKLLEKTDYKLTCKDVLKLKMETKNENK